ncbi:PP2C family protein-serine/threonine phosphatase [Deinococcus sp. Marseille-Q6407]|uniref:PP2C family protein-serine/threonine phosphatase n=1 Tax=Deinococcus sp. Marseille-Q6407 TaxID=2969223 RepID=UPI0021BFD311|nr:PP2C family serine/threonine-protein phosphatase [Deinococcus sp. Marseille-Q6407]
MFSWSSGLSRLGRAELQAACLTDVGRQRRGSANQDSLVEAELPGAQLFAVADGMGGHAAGELASRLALETFAGVMQRQREPLAQRAIFAAEKANQAVYRRAVGDLSGMGTTLLAAMITQATLYLTHIGDSRAYLLRGEALYRLTDDHSWVAEQLRAGQLTPEQAQAHRWRNVVSNALGGEERVRLELLSVPLEPGDRLLLCTDGLYGPVGDYKLLTILSLPRSPEQVARLLIDQANQAGGPDNISAVVVDVLSPGRPPLQLPPGRWHDGPVYAEQLLSEVRQGTPVNYLLLGAVYLILLVLALLPLYRIYTALLGLFALVLLLVYARRLRFAGSPVLHPEARITLVPDGDGAVWNGKTPLKT